MSDAHALLLRALAKHVGGAAKVAAAHSEAWASATFRGVRHRIALHIAGDDAPAAAERLSHDLADAEFRLPGHLVADLAVTGREDTAAGVALAVEALTVEEA